ncbi:hypothetical protein ACF0H5_001073 [Mactra antiquata]
MMVTGIIFTAVAHGSQSKGSTVHFPYVGPMLISIAVSSIMSGFVLNRLKDIRKMLDYIKYSETHSLKTNDEQEANKEIIGTLNILCYKLLFCLYKRRIDSSEHVQNDTTSGEPAVGDKDEPSPSRSKVPILQRLSSFTSLRQLKVHPVVSDTSLV